jgi:hypothetical protein
VDGVLADWDGCQCVFLELEKLEAEVKRMPSDFKGWLQKQDTYTLHRPVRKRFPRNPYTVNNIMDVWKCDLVDIQTLAKYRVFHDFMS